MIVEAFKRWQFRLGFRNGHADAKAKAPVTVAPGSSYASGYRLGIACYALSLDLDAAMAAAEEDWFRSDEKSAG